MLRASASRSVLLRSILIKNQFHSSARASAVQPFLMPAMSPTMEKGGIVEWAVKVGEPFSAGDLLLNVETDKSQIDVEALDDGKIVKILENDGAKDVAVGKTIAFIADVNDDMNTIVIPDVNGTTTKSPDTEPVTTPKVVKAVNGSTQTFKSTDGPKLKADNNQTMYPSVLLELEMNGISKKEAIKNIEPTGRNGRILKGDVLSYLGKIPKDSAQKIASYIKDFEKLDLKNIEIKTLEPSEDEKPSSTADTVKGEQPIKEDIILSENIVFHVKQNVDYEQLRKSLRSYIDSAYHKAHRESSSNIYSELYDDAFESLLTQDESKARFKVNFELIKVETEQAYAQPHSNDIFDLLSNNSHKTVDLEANDNRNTAPTESEYLVSLSVKLEDQYSDALDKAELFMSLMRQLQF
ncbi:hypothetical protein TPHA_0A04740 [Tetrapisispora phaffii CBS 4417]|uniref:Uncharacterized protein n=1 Tax=Tetrapisispora phaffii (strain ATCC 24235 / CBS 4417 / NBRC 1672 / NRRL Y-8282 / UCD 70-5) TaxID=1071381 RepID=G8BNS1_TETPH|nr:hypothetical protein TPHA_0A04740 [Tetrapisispora phaffii CBS 4417]CCE61549.1 hypothetical protein TPHA_0A04740 [Tetrapisispora phaffii CBS 4417]